MPSRDKILAGGVYLVTGGTQGIGEAVALALARAGARAQGEGVSRPELAAAMGTAILWRPWGRDLPGRAIPGTTNAPNTWKRCCGRFAARVGVTSSHC